MTVAARQGIRQAGAHCAALVRAACVLLLLAAMTLTAVSGHADHAVSGPDVHAATVDDSDMDQPGPAEPDCSVHPGCHAVTLPAATPGPVAIAAPLVVAPNLIRLSGRVGPPLPQPPEFS